jgi:hypothetical protein
VALCEDHAVDFAVRAAVHDRENTCIDENIEAMKASGVLACAPAEFGGLGVESVHDLAVAASRPGRGRASTGISDNMHIGGVWAAMRWWRRARLSVEHPAPDDL